MYYVLAVFMKINFSIRDFILLLAISFFTYLNLSYWKSTVLGTLFAPPYRGPAVAVTICYLLFVAYQAVPILSKFFNFQPRAWRTKILAIFLALITLGWIGGIVLVFYKLTALSIAVIFFINGLIYLFLKQWAQKSKNNIKEINVEHDNKLKYEVPKAKIGVLLYLILLGIGFYLLIISKTGVAVLSPWQTIQPYYIPIFFLATLTLGLLIFSKLNVRSILFLLVLHSILLHSYLPLTHDLLYGADQWRHLAVESQLVEEQSLNLISFDKGNVSLIQSLNPGKLAYSQLWATEVILSRTLSINLLTINKWLVPIIWSIILPLLLFELAVIFNWKKKKALLFVWLGFLPFAWQSIGSMTLPVSYGFLVWLLLVILLLKRLKQPRWEQLVVLGLATLGSLFGYSLFFLLFLLSWVIMEIISNISNSKKKSHVMCYVLCVTCLSAIIIPVLELFTKYSYFNPNINLLNQSKQFIGNITGWFLATGPRTHDIAGGNIIFNQTPNYAFVENIFTYSLYWIPVLMILFLVAAIIGLFVALREKQAKYLWLVIMSISIWTSYELSFYFLSGERILSRRLDTVLALTLLLLFFIALNKYILSKKKKLTFILIFIFSFVITASYSLGPDTKIISMNEYKAMEYVWSQNKDENKYCIIADTYPLLALEYFSNKKIIGGGFSINQYFAQPERVDLFNKMKHNISNENWKKALSLTGAKKCWFVGGGNMLEDKVDVVKKWGNIVLLKSH